jgi:hypothetical protein
MSRTTSRSEARIPLEQGGGLAWVYCRTQLTMIPCLLIAQMMFKPIGSKRAMITGNHVFRQALEWNMESRLLGILGAYAVFLEYWPVWLVAAAVFLGTFNTTFITLINTSGQRGWYVLFANLATWLGLGFAVAITSWTGRQAEYWMPGLLISQIIVMLLSGVVIYRVARLAGQWTRGTK